jgi:uncharacterized protein YbbK (DUF523 family)
MPEKRGFKIKMRGYLLVSACLAGRSCRYDGTCVTTPVEEICRKYESSGHLIAVCPEQLGGLPTPRESSEIRGEDVYTAGGARVSAQFLLGAQRALSEVAQRPVTAAILKSRSPSCGYRTIYDGTFTGVLISGTGIFARMLAQSYPLLPIFDELEIDRIRTLL